MKRGVETRVIAATILQRIVDEGAYSNIVIRTGTRDLEHRDAVFVQRLVYAAVRYLIRIDRTIKAFASRRVESSVLAVLRIGVAEILFTDGDDYAAVDSAVEAVRSLGTPRAAGFVNGVLRNVVRNGEPELPGGAEGEALRFGVQGWLYRRLVDSYGKADTASFLDASNRPASVSVRDRDAVVPGERVEGIDGAFTVEDIGAYREELAEGRLVVADASSTAVGLALDPRPGDRILDLAAAPGGKTLHLWDLIGGDGMLVAMDRHQRRAGRAARRLGRAGADVAWVIGDAADPPFREGSFDRVLLDAPCTGLGTLRRRPEIRHRVHAGGPVTAGKLQRQMLESAIALLRPGGRLVYSVCTVTPEETTAVVAGTGSVSPPGTPGLRMDGGLLLAPHLTGSDGMFIAVIDRE